MQSMGYRKLELTLHSANHLRDVKFIGTMNPFAVVTIEDNWSDVKMVPEIFKTPVAKKNGTNPIWDSAMKFDVLPMSEESILSCKIKHHGTLFDRQIGEVRLPLVDLLAGDGSGDKVRYPVKKTGSNEVQGEIILSHKFSDPILRSGEEKDDGGASASTSAGGSTPARKKPVNGKKRRKLKRILKNVGESMEALLFAGAVVAQYDDEDGDEYDEEEEEDEDYDA